MLRTRLRPLRRKYRILGVPATPSGSRLSASRPSLKATRVFASSPGYTQRQSDKGPPIAPVTHPGARCSIPPALAGHSQSTPSSRLVHPHITSSQKGNGCTQNQSGTACRPPTHTQSRQSSPPPTHKQTRQSSLPPTY